MLLTKNIETKWNNSNKKRLEGFGYKYTKIGDSIIIDINHLSPYSNIYVNVECDYCGVKHEKPYQNYTTQRKVVQKDSCYECRYEKEKDIIKYKQENNKLKKGDRRYYFLRENRLKELDSYIKKYGNIDCMDQNEEGSKLISNLYNHKEDVYKMSIELGYDLPSITSKKPSWYYEDFDAFKNDIQKVVDKYGGFPSSNQLMRELNISNRPIDYHGGIYEIRRMMGYDDDKYLDNSGFYNNSFYETVVANYLIAQGLENKYRREEHPFPEHEGKYRSDFTFYLDNGEKIYCEVWGYSYKNSMIADSYNDVRNIKENLYKKYSLKLISIEPDIFRKSYKDIDKHLYEKFKDCLNLKLKKVSQKLLIPTNLMSDEELLVEIMKHSSNKEFLPNVTTLIQDTARYYNEIIKRYNTYQDFGIKFNKKVEYASNGYWSKEKIFEVFDYMIESYGKILDRNECKDIKELSKFSYIIQSNAYGGLINNKLDYFELCVNNGRNIPDIEIKFLYDVARENSLPYSKSITKENVIQSQSILSKLKESDLLESRYYDFVRKDYGQEDNLLNLAFDIFDYMIENYGKILPENKFRDFKKSDKKLDEINIYKRIYRSEKYDLQQVKDMFYDYLNNKETSKNSITKI